MKTILFFRDKISR